MSKKLAISLAVVLFWTAAWCILDWYLPDLLFAGPLNTWNSLCRQIQTLLFWRSILHSLCKIITGFLLALLSGLLCAVLCYFVRPVAFLLEPAVQVMKTVPVACFIIVALIWISSENISILVASFVVFPAVYINLSQGLRQVDPKLLEMAAIFRISPLKKLRALYLPQIMPYLLSSCQLGVGMAWKAGVAGEIIGLPDCSIGDQLYLAKLYLNIDDLFAWTIVIIGISLLCEKFVIRILQQFNQRWQKGSKYGYLFQAGR